jgi:hypothetical protein
VNRTNFRTHPVRESSKRPRIPAVLESSITNVQNNTTNSGPKLGLVQRELDVVRAASLKRHIQYSSLLLNGLHLKEHNVPTPTTDMAAPTARIDGKRRNIANTRRDIIDSGFSQVSSVRSSHSRTISQSLSFRLTQFNLEAQIVATYLCLSSILWDSFGD